MALHVVVLATNRGARMKSSRPTALHVVSGQPLIEHVLRAVDGIPADSVTVVTGEHAAEFREALAPRQLEFAERTEEATAGKSGTVLIINGIAPLIQTATLSRVLDEHRNSKSATATIDLTNESGEELRPVTSRVDLADLGRILRERKNQELMLAGVTFQDPSSVSVDVDVKIGADTIIGPGVLLEGSTSIGADCRIHAGSRLTNTTVGDDVIVLDHCVLIDARVDSHARIGPFAHLRPASVVGEGAHVGNFVELKKTTLGKKSKANHLAYLGDATIGEAVNVGAGTITCNYDGVSKNPTIIEDGAFIGSDSQLIAPVTIGAGAYVAAGSSITKDVPPDALGVSRARQENKLGWAAKRRSRNRKDT